MNGEPISADSENRNPDVDLNVDFWEFLTRNHLPEWHTDSGVPLYEKFKQHAELKERQKLTNAMQAKFDARASDYRNVKRSIVAVIQPIEEHLHLHGLLERIHALLPDPPRWDGSVKMFAEFALDCEEIEKQHAWFTNEGGAFRKMGKLATRVNQMEDSQQKELLRFEQELGGNRRRCDKKLEAIEQCKAIMSESASPKKSPTVATQDDRWKDRPVSGGKKEKIREKIDHEVTLSRLKEQLGHIQDEHTRLEQELLSARLRMSAEMQLLMTQLRTAYDIAHRNVSTIDPATRKTEVIDYAQKRLLSMLSETSKAIREVLKDALEIGKKRMTKASPPAPQVESVFMGPHIEQRIISVENMTYDTMERGQNINPSLRPLIFEPELPTIFEECKSNFGRNVAALPQHKAPLQSISRLLDEKREFIKMKPTTGIMLPFLQNLMEKSFARGEECLRKDREAGKISEDTCAQMAAAVTYFAEWVLRSLDKMGPPIETSPEQPLLFEQLFNECEANFADGNPTLPPGASEIGFVKSAMANARKSGGFPLKKEVIHSAMIAAKGLKMVYKDNHSIGVRCSEAMIRAIILFAEWCVRKESGK